MLTVWCLSSISNLVQIYVIVTEINTHLCSRRSVDDVTRINFRFRLLVMWSYPRVRDASPHIILCKISISSPGILTFFLNSRWRLLPSWIFSLRKFGHSGVYILWCLCSVPNLDQIYVIVTEIDVHMLQTFIWWRHANYLSVSTFGHVVISAWPWCIFPYNLVQDISIQSRDTDSFSEIQDGGCRHLVFSVYVNLSISAWW